MTHSRKNIILLAGIVIASALNACRASTSTPADYRLYFKEIKKALERVAAEDFQEALTIYQRTFARYRFIFPRDAFNALQFAIFLDNKGARDSLVKRGAESGVARKTFLQSPRVREAFMPADSLLFEQLFLAGRTIWAASVDTTLRQEMIERYRYEQASKSSPEYRNICTNNFKRITALAKAGRFPGEGRIGVADDLVNEYVVPTLCHYPFSYKFLQKELYAAMLDGQLQPTSLIYIYGFNQSMRGALYRPGTPRDTVTFAKRYNTGFSLKSSDTAAVNRARAEMFIVSLETETRLKDVSHKHRIAIELGW